MNLQKTSRTTLVLSLLCALSSAPAAYAGLFDGFTLSAGLGHISGQASSKAIDKQGAIVRTNAAGKFASSGFAGLLGLGYNFKVSECGVLGIELQGFIPSLDFQAPSSQPKKVFGKMKSGFAFLLKPGYLVNTHTFFYGILGFGGGQFSSTPLLEEPELTPGPRSQSKLLTGISYGLGAMTKISQQIGVGAEFIRTNYKKLSLKRTVSPAFAVNAVNERVLLPTTNTFWLRVSCAI